MFAFQSSASKSCSNPTGCLNHTELEILLCSGHRHASLQWTHGCSKAFQNDAIAAKLQAFDERLGGGCCFSLSLPYTRSLLLAAYSHPLHAVLEGYGSHQPIKRDRLLSHPLIAFCTMLTEWKPHGRIGGSRWASTPAFSETHAQLSSANRWLLPRWCHMHDPAGVATCENGTEKAQRGAQDCLISGVPAACSIALFAKCDIFLFT